MARNSLFRENRVPRTIRRLAALAFAVLVSLPAVAADQTLIERGRYLAVLGDCRICHTVPGVGAPSYAGGYALHAYFGTVYSSNLTSDPVTGIGAWTQDQFYRAMNRGIAADGSFLYPAFPYPYFRHVARADTDALFAYLMSLKPVRYQPPPNRLMFPGDIRLSMFFWDVLFRTVPPMPKDEAQPEAWKRGAEIVNGLGHCGDCHTPKNFLFSDELGQFMQGGLIDSWFAADLTGAKRGGLGDWSRDDIVTYLKTGRNGFGRVTGSMQDVVRVSTSEMTDADLNAVADYLKSLPAVPEKDAPLPDKTALDFGEAVYVQRCAVCHDDRSGDYPSLVRNTLVQSRNAATVLRVILQGSEAVDTENAKAGFSMPAFPSLSNAELADVATYIRNMNGNRAPAVTANDAGNFRIGLPPRD